ncbi:MAG: pyridoxal phosphate-dependent aminotransferase family protein [Bdellovibrionota bacterium]
MKQTRPEKGDIFTKVHSGRAAERLGILKSCGYNPFFHTFRIDPELGSSQIRIDGKAVLNFGSNDYLGLTLEVKQAAQDAIEKFGTGCSGSRLLNGSIDLHLELESALANFLGKDSAAIFGTGFQTNLAALSSLGGIRDVIITDESCHASITDGVRLSYARRLRFKHNDPHSLNEALTNCDQSAGKLVALDGVYSCAGDLADLGGLLPVCKQHAARVYLDDAHGLGILGEKGRGTAEQLGVEDEIDIIAGTFSKSLASSGGFIAGDTELIDYVKHYASPFVFSAALPPAATAAALAALRIIEEDFERRRNLIELSQYARQAFNSCGFAVNSHLTPIIMLDIGAKSHGVDDSIDLLSFCCALLEKGFYVNPMIGSAAELPVIRVNITTKHTRNEIDALADAISDLTKRESYEEIANE